MAVERLIQAHGGDIHIVADGGGRVYGNEKHNTTIPSVGAGAALTTQSGWIYVSSYHKLKRVTFGASAITAISAGTDPTVDVYRHLPVPVGLAAALADPAVAGNVEDGAHFYSVVFYNGVGNGPQAATVSVTVADKTTNGKVVVTLPLGPTGTTGRKIYRSEAAGTALKLLATVADNTTLSYTDNIADGSLGAAIGTDNVAAATVLTAPVKLSTTAATGADVSRVRTPLVGTLANGVDTTIWPPCLYSVRALTGASTGAITNLDVALDVEAYPG